MVEVVVRAGNHVGERELRGVERRCGQPTVVERPRKYSFAMVRQVGIDHHSCFSEAQHHAGLAERPDADGC